MNLPNRTSSSNIDRKHNRNSGILMLVLLFAIGVIISLQIKTIEEQKKKTEAAKADIQYYTALLESERKYTEETTYTLEQLKAQKNALLLETLTNSGYTAILEQMQRINLIAGFTEIRGPGVTVVLDDQLVDDPSFPAITSAVHDLDIRQVIDIMRSAGASAISVNGQRVVSTSELTCNGPTVQINKRKYPVPYVIQCVGDPEIIIAMLNGDEYINSRILSNIEFSVEASEEIVIMPFSDYDRISQYIDALGGDIVS